MKKIIILLILMVGCIIINAQVPHYEITDKIDEAEGVTFVLQKNVAGKIIYLDTVVVLKGTFKITGGSVEYPEMVSLVTMDKKKGFSFFLENSNITITGRLDSLSNVKVNGSKTQDEFSVLNASMKPIIEKITRITNEYKTASDAIMKEIRAIQKDFVINNPNSFVSPNILRGLVNDMKPDEIESIINSMNPSVANTKVIADIKAKILAVTDK